MNYREIPPSAVLDECIQCYWAVDGALREEESTQSILPDGCFDLVIDVDLSGRNIVLLTGIWDQPVPVTVRKNLPTVGVRFYPAAIDAFFNCRIADCRNTAIAFSEDMLRGNEQISMASLWATNDVEDLLAFLDCCFVLLKMSLPPENDLLPQARQKTPGQSVGGFATEAGLSPRQLHRHYQSRFGISPKTYFSILRFLEAKQLLATRADMEFADIALESHYYDQAHFIREIKRFSGMTPSAFRQKRWMSDSYNTVASSFGIVE